MAVCAGAAAATGSLFICTDSSGKTITGDVPPPECANRPIRELNRDGSVRQVIAPPLTPEQRAQKAAEDRRKAEEEKLRRDQARRDRALLDAYGDENEIEQARARSIEGRRVIIDRARKRLGELQRERKKLDDEAEFYVRRQQPERLKRAYATNADMVKAQEKIIDDTDAELKRINERFDADRQRFQELIQGGAKPAQRSASTSTR
ncbi:MAG: hypothetical protein ACM3PU_04860 [Gemmatimonadota bacterium]